MKNTRDEHSTAQHSSSYERDVPRPEYPKNDNASKRSSSVVKYRIEYSST